MNEQEEWRWIPGYEGRYMVSSSGRIKSFVKYNTGKIISERRKNNCGYPSVRLRYAPKKSEQFLVHRLVAKAFIPNSENKPFINHKNFIKSDNRIENLEWCTQHENMLYTNEHNGPHSIRGTKNMWAKLNENDVLNIRDLRKQGKSGPQIAQMFNISISHANMVSRKSSWKHLKDVEVSIGK